MGRQSKKDLIIRGRAILELQAEKVIALNKFECACARNVTIYGCRVAFNLEVVTDVIEPPGGRKYIDPDHPYIQGVQCGVSSLTLDWWAILLHSIRTLSVKSAYSPTMGNFILASQKNAISVMKDIMVATNIIALELYNYYHGGVPEVQNPSQPDIQEQAYSIFNEIEQPLKDAIAKAVTP